MMVCRSLKTGSPNDLIRWLLDQDRDAVFDITRHRVRRSLKANAYAWALTNEIANVLRTSKDEVHRNMLRKYGQSAVIRVSARVPIEKYFEYYDRIEGTDEVIEYRVYAGTHEYDSREMAIFIDGIVSEAKELDIETLPPEEIKRLKEMWRK